LRLRPLAFATFLVWWLRIGACGVGAYDSYPGRTGKFFLPLHLCAVSQNNPQKADLVVSKQVAKCLELKEMLARRVFAAPASPGKSFQSIRLRLEQITTTDLYQHRLLLNSFVFILDSFVLIHSSFAEFAIRREVYVKQTEKATELDGLKVKTC